MPETDPTTALLIQLLPLMIIQIIYAVIVFLLCKKQNWNAWLIAIATLIPGVGILVFLLVLLITLFNTLDRLNKLEGKT